MQSRIVIRIVSWPLYRDVYRDFAGDTQPYCTPPDFLGGRESGRSTEQSASEAASDMESLAAFSSDPLKVTIQLAPDEGR